MRISDELGNGTIAVPSPPAELRNWPVVGDLVHEFWSKASINLEAAFRQLAPYLKPVASYLLVFAGGFGVGALKFLLSVILAGFLFQSGPRLVEAGKEFLSHVVAQRSEDFLSLAGATIRSISQGVIGIAIFQSLVIGLGLKIVGVPHAGIISLAVLIFGILQIGSLIVLLPVVIWIWSTKDFATAVPITIFLMLAGVSDNILKPLLMGRNLTTPMPVIFIGLIGGTLAHGIVGLFVGPIILAVAWELLKAWIHEDESHANRLAWSRYPTGIRCLDLNQHRQWLYRLPSLHSEEGSTPCHQTTPGHRAVHYRGSLLPPWTTWSMRDSGACSFLMFCANAAISIVEHLAETAPHVLNFAAELIS